MAERLVSVWSLFLSSRFPGNPPEVRIFERAVSTRTLKNPLLVYHSTDFLKSIVDRCGPINAQESCATIAAENAIAPKVLF